MGKITRKKLFVDEQRITSVELDKTKPESSNSFTIRSNLFAYFWNEPIMKEWYKELKSTTSVVHFTTLIKRDKKNYIRFHSKYLERFNRGQKLYRVFQTENNWTAFHAVLSTQKILYESEIYHLLVSKFYHDQRSENWLGSFIFTPEIDPQQGLLSNAQVGQKLYLYKSESDSNIHVLHYHILDWPIPDKYSLDIGYSVRDFKFVFENLNDTLKTLIVQSQDLINTESGQEETTCVLTSNNFNPNYKGIDESIKKYKNTSITYYINESYNKKL